MNANDNIGVNKNVKDSLFRRLFGEDKENALSLYNALNNTEYKNADDLYFTTLEDVVFMKMKNDVSFLLSSSLNLYEHQSTYNPNMPLRGFFYFADLYRQLLGKQEDIYSKRLIRLPYPNYVVFYNGPDSDMQQESEKLKLSNAFYKRDENEIINQEVGDREFEWTATMVNINYGKNKELMKKCRILSEYSIFISRVKEYNKHMDTATAIHRAVEDCIKENVLSDFLSRHRREVIDVFLTEFNEERYREVIREDARIEGLEAGLAEGRAKGRAEGATEKGIKIFLNLLEQGFSMENAQAVSELSDEEVREALKRK